MESSCAFSNCKNYSEEIFCSPKDPILLKQWQKAANTKQTNFSVCINHFRKEDIIIEKTIENCAIPIKDDLRWKKNACGSCLMDLSNQMTMPNKETSRNFYEITEYHLVTDLLCIKCSQFLKSFSRFKNEIKEKHRRARLQFDVEDHDKDTLLSCPYCSYHSFDNDAYTLHLCAVHGETSSTMIKISSEEVVEESSVQCFYCSKKFKTDALLQIHQARYHPKKNSVQTPKSTIVIQSPRSLSSPKSNLDRKRLQLLAKLENTIKRRVPPIIKVSKELEHIPPTPITTRSSTLRQTPKKKKEENFEIFEVNEVKIKEEMVEVEVEIKEEPEEEPAVEIRNVEDILSNKNRRKQNIIKEQTSTNILFKEEPEEPEEEEEEELIIAEVAEDESSEEDSSSESEKERVFNKIKYIPASKKPKVVIQPNFSEQVQCLDCKEFMNISELADHRDVMHTKVDNQSYDDIRNSDLPPPLVKKTYKSRKPKSLTPLPCNVCGIVMQEWKLEKHIEQYHSDKPLPFLCHICSRTFAQITMFKYHMASHDPELQYRCDLCGKGFIRKSRMVNHIKRSHMNIYTVRGVCPICNQKIYKTPRVKKHMEKYHPNGLDEGYRVNPETNYFDCYKCGASYADLYTYKRHDCGKGRYQMRCSDCRKPVKNEESLQKHRETKCPRLNKHSVLNN